MSSLLKMLLGPAKQPAESRRIESESKEIARIFDDEYYRRHYPEVIEAGIAPIEHYLTIGWLQGKNPSADFDTCFYLEANPDVRAANMNPLVHFVRHGEAEGRLPEPATGTPPSMTRPAAAPPVHSYNESDMNSVRPLFDSAYYLSIYPDVRKAGIDPLLHYMNVGWREFRNPSANFNTATYLQLNKDVAASGINPLLHYAFNGRHEDRIIRLDCLEELKVLEQKYNRPPAQSRPVTLAIEPCEKLTEYLAACGRKDLVVALSHDDYLTNVGGIQIFISEEERRFRAADRTYMHLSPIYSEGDFTTFNDCIQIAINGERVGVYSLSDVTGMLRRRVKTKASGAALIIHSLINTDESYVLKKLLQIPWKKKYFWIHDYSLMCDEFNLLRNGIQPCGYPPADSAACFTCTGYGSRSRKAEILQQLVKNGFVFLTPSDAARKIAARAPHMGKNKIQVVNHITLSKEKRLKRKTYPDSSRLRVAYCGHPVLHKGWGVFQRAVERSIHLNKYDFFHLGVHNTRLNGIEFIDVRNDTTSRDRMVDAIREHEIDVVVVAALWPETFCYVAYEAILGGAMVFTTPDSGNVAALSRTVSHVKVFDSFQDLVNSFSTGEAVRLVSAAFAKGMPAYKAAYNGTTAAVEVRE